jgi:glycosyltransferase involved in cell wall biosynthesis
MKFETGKKMLFVSSYPPRECGLATFSNDIVNAIKIIFGDTLPIEVCALQNKEKQCSYSNEVTYTINSTKLEEFQIIAEKINERKDIGLVCIQHEFGLFGGEYGDYVLAFILALNKPIATIFHTILPNPDQKRKKIVHVIADLSDKIIVLTKRSQEILTSHYDCPISKTQVIPHGNHSMLWEQKEKLKNKYDLSNKIVLSTFGLISENKNIETTLFALSEIVIKHPEVVYFIIGKTHPEIIRKEGEKYRNLLIATVAELQLENNVVFINEYLELKELLEYLTLSDIYLFSSKDPNQAVRGTFAYAMSCGCAVISTPIPHAVEALEHNAGILLKEFNDPKEFKAAIVRLIENKEERIAMAKNAFSLSQSPTWENVAIKYGLMFGELTNREEDLRFNLPPIKIDHIKKLTTGLGILQFSKFSEPDPESGYTLDDNARALIDMVMYNKLFPDDGTLIMANIYLKYIEDIQRETGWFDNYKNFENQLTKQNGEVNLEDANGRALWSLGTVIAHKETLPVEFVTRAKICWDKAIIRLPDINSPRAIAYAIKGLYNYYSIYKDNVIKKHIEKLANELLRHYQINSEVNWCWYED